MNEDEELDLFPLVPQEQELIVDGDPDPLSIVNMITSKGRDQKVIFVDAAILFVYFFVIIASAAVRHSSGFVSTAFVELLHSILLCVALFGDYYYTIGPDERHTYGYGRSIIICCFAISLIIILSAIFILQEALMKFMMSSKSVREVNKMKSVEEILPNGVGFLFYSVSAFLLRHQSSNPLSSKTPHLYAAFLVFMSGTLHSFAHFATGFVDFFNLPAEISYQASPLFHGLIALIIIDLSKNLFYHSFLVLMQSTPSPLLKVADKRIGETIIDKMIREASHMEGVLECKSAHFWSINFNDFVGTLHIRAKSDADEQHIISQIHSKFDPIIRHFTAQVEKDHWEHLGTLSNSKTDDEYSGLTEPSLV